MVDSSLVVAARKCADLTQEEAALISGISTDSYRSREPNPGDFRVREIEKLASGISKPAREILKNAFTSIFLE